MQHLASTPSSTKPSLSVDSFLHKGILLTYVPKFAPLLPPHCLIKFFFPFNLIPFLKKLSFFSLCSFSGEYFSTCSRLGLVQSSCSCCSDTNEGGLSCAKLFINITPITYKNPFSGLSYICFSKKSVYFRAVRMLLGAFGQRGLLIHSVFHQMARRKAKIGLLLSKLVRCLVPGQPQRVQHPAIPS